MSVLCSSDRPLIMTVVTVIINGRSEEHKTDMFNDAMVPVRDKFWKLR